MCPQPNLQAVSAYNLVMMVHDVFGEIQRVVAGTTLLTQKIQTVAKFLLSGTVPPAWDRAWEGPENIQMWLRLPVFPFPPLPLWVCSCPQGQPNSGIGCVNDKLCVNCGLD